MFHLDTDFLIHAFGSRGPERARLLQLSESGHDIQMSAIAWYEYTRGPRPAELIATARTVFRETGIVPFSEALAERAAEVFRQLGSPRRRASDIAIGVTASVCKATLLTRNERDFADIPGLQLECVSTTS